MSIMPSEYILKNFSIYEKYLERQPEHDNFMKRTAKQYIKVYKEEISKLDSVDEKKVLTKLISYYEVKENYLVCALLQKILIGEKI